MKLYLSSHSDDIADFRFSITALSRLVTLTYKLFTWELVRNVSLLILMFLRLFVVESWANMHQTVTDDMTLLLRPFTFDITAHVGDADYRTPPLYQV